MRKFAVKNFKYLTKIVSGGQTGVDQSGLEAASDLEISTGGYITKGFMTENGKNPDLGKKFGLIELESENYVIRSKANVDVSDGTLAIRLHKSNGTDKTIGYCQTGFWIKGKPETRNKGGFYYKPVFVITSFENRKRIKRRFKKFIFVNEISVLNVAGHRESSSGMENFQEICRKLLRECFEGFLNRKNVIIRKK